jgi:phage shock protein C
MSSPATTCPRCVRELPAEARYCPTCGTRTCGAPRALRRRRDAEKLAGVCSGLGEYFDLDPTFVRVLYAVITLFTGIVPGLVLYVILAIIIPTD